MVRTYVLRVVVFLLISIFLCSGCNILSPSLEEVSLSDSVASLPPAVFTEKRQQELMSYSDHILALLNSANYSSVVDLFFSDDLRDHYSAKQLEVDWIALGKVSESDTRSASYSQKQGYDIIYQPIQSAKGMYNMQLSIDVKNRIAGFYVHPVVEEPTREGYLELPNTLVEREMVFEAQHGYPLSCLLTLPASRSGKIPAVVLVHDSGPYDRDETMGVNQPFREMAYLLAEAGIGVLRYDKITKTYEHQLFGDAQMMNRFSVEQETVLDALHAVELLKEQPEIDENRVYLLGHGQGGMLAPYISAEGADVAGLILMASSAQTRWQVIHDYNMIQLERAELQGADVSNDISMLRHEWERASKIESMPWEEAEQTSFFGSGGYYLKHWAHIDTIGLIHDLGKPCLVMQPGSDEQLYGQQEFMRWREANFNASLVQLQYYPQLNHIMSSVVGWPSPSELEDQGAPAISVYTHRMPMARIVIEDIVAWIGLDEPS